MSNLFVCYENVLKSFFLIFQKMENPDSPMVTDDEPSTVPTDTPADADQAIADPAQAESVLEPLAIRDDPAEAPAGPTFWQFVTDQLDTTAYNAPFAQHDVTSTV